MGNVRYNGTGLRIKRWSTSLLVVSLAAPFAPRVARADSAAAQALFQEARRLATAGKFEAACPKFEESLRLEPGAGTRYNLADCYEHIGRTASAWGAFRDVEGATKLAGQTARSDAARNRADKLEPGLCRLDVRVASPSPGEVVERDGAVIGEGQFGAAIPIDPGAHTVQAKATGKLVWETTFLIKTCPATLTVNVPALDDAPVAPVPVVEAKAPPAPKPTRAPDTTARRVAMWSSFGLAAVGVGVGTAFGVDSLAKDARAEPYCKGQFCDPTGSDIRAQALRSGDASTAAFVAAGVFAVAGAILLITMPSSDPQHAKNGILGERAELRF